MSERRAQIHVDHALSRTRRCELLGVARSTAYYPPQAISDEELALMRQIDEMHLEMDPNYWAVGKVKSPVGFRPPDQG